MSISKSYLRSQKGEPHFCSSEIHTQRTTFLGHMRFKHQDSNDFFIWSSEGHPHMRLKNETQTLALNTYMRLKRLIYETQTLTYETQKLIYETQTLT